MSDMVGEGRLRCDCVGVSDGVGGGRWTYFFGRLFDVNSSVSVVGGAEVK